MGGVNQALDHALATALGFALGWALYFAAKALRSAVLARRAYRLALRSAEAKRAFEEVP